VGRVFAAALVGLALGVPSVAHATTVRFYPEDELTLTDAYFDVSDGTGQRNDLAITIRRAGLTVVEHGSAPLRAGHGCRRRGGRRVTCSGRALVEIEAGRGADRLLVRCHGVDVDVAGGPGDDRLAVRGGCPAGMQGEGGRDALTGDGAGQWMSGGGARDRLAGGGGDDRIYGDGNPRYRGDDLIDGGGGDDVVAYDERHAPVHVDLARGTGGGRHEHDRLRGVEDVFGGSAPDVLEGDGGPNRLLGANGNDVLVGRGGDDRLSGGDDRDYFDDKQPDRFRCGSGTDVVVFPARRALRHDCERMQERWPLDARSVPTRPRRAGRHRVAVPVVCQRELTSCRRSVEVRAGKRILGRTDPVAKRGGLHWVAVSLHGRARRGEPLTIEVGGSDTDRYDDTSSYAFTWRIGCTGAPPFDACRAGAG
jgi:hypothetical protein